MCGDGEVGDRGDAEAVEVWQAEEDVLQNLSLAGVEGDLLPVEQAVQGVDSAEGCVVVRPPFGESCCANLVWQVVLLFFVASCLL